MVELVSHGREIFPCHCLASECSPSTLPHYLGVGDRLEAPPLYTEGNQGSAMRGAVPKNCSWSSVLPGQSMSPCHWSVVSGISDSPEQFGREGILSLGASLASGRGQGSGVGNIGLQLDSRIPRTLLGVSWVGGLSGPVCRLVGFRGVLEMQFHLWFLE